MQNKIYFFEVEANEKAVVLKKYPEAICIKKPFTKLNAKHYKDAAIICGFIQSEFDKKTLSQLPQLKLIITRSAGFNHIDLDYAKAKGIKVCNVADYGSFVIAEFAIGLLLAATRNIVEGNKRAKRYKFCYQGLCGNSLQGKTLGVVGVGKIGNQVCKIASKGFGMKVIAFDKFPDSKLAKKNGFTYTKSLNKIWKESDFISLHTPLNTKTKHLINTKTIAKMKDGVVLVNTARGGLVDSKALLAGLKKGKIAKVALDVIEDEKNAKKEKALLQNPNVIATPHIAFYAEASKENMYCAAMQSVEEFLTEKKLTHQVNSH
jgi:D-lactate dehydrogenase